MAEPLDDVKRLDAEMRALGLPGLDRVTGALEAASAPELDAPGRLAAVVKAYVGLVDASLALIDGELKKVEALRSQTPTPDPARASLDDVVFAFHEQKDGLFALKAFFAHGDRAQLQAAREKLQRGAQTARHAARHTPPT
jgi:hypothetical protein